ncbi:LOB domain-containing protein 22-like [Typha latifolia]|uniref:LOB domain-containing protein 22-like n=1 Tax=Typha latifolia TaxID=4733 RepID=UPI003C2EF949
MTTPSSSGQSSPTWAHACAACKHQRRKCKADCPLARYFPADQPDRFVNAYRHFGVSNILRIIRGVRPEDRDAAMNSITMESNIRARDPVGGCYAIICKLELQLRDLYHELSDLKRELALYHAQEQNAESKCR